MRFGCRGVNTARSHRSNHSKGMTKRKPYKVAPPLFGMGIASEYQYHVFALVRGNRKRAAWYIAQGADLGVVHDAPTITCLASDISDCHARMLEGEGDRAGVLRDYGYLGFSFDPPCERAIYRGRIYCTQRFSGNQQRYFLNKLRKKIDWIRDDDDPT